MVIAAAELSILQAAAYLRRKRERGGNQHLILRHSLIKAGKKTDGVLN